MNIKISSTGGLLLGDATNGYKEIASKEYVDTKTASIAWADITGKPSTFAPAEHTHSSLKNGNYTASLPSMSANGTIALASQIPAAQVNANWNETSSSSKAYIQNKPTLGTAAAKDVGTGSNQVAAGDHTHSDYVSKSATSVQTIASSVRLSGGKGLSVGYGENNGGYVYMEGSSTSGGAAYIDIIKGGELEGIEITPNSLIYSTDGFDTTSTLLFPAASASGKIATDTQVNTAISTINTNFTDIQTMLTIKEESNISVGSRASGWTFSPDGETWSNKLRFFHWGHIAYISGSAKCSSALTANSMTSSIGTMSLPSGYTLIGANAGIPGGDYWFWSSAAGVMGCKTFVAKTANTSLAIRIVFVLNSIGNKYTKTTVSNI